MHGDLSRKIEIPYLNEALNTLMPPPPPFGRTLIVRGRQALGRRDFGSEGPELMVVASSEGGLGPRAAHGRSSVGSQQCATTLRRPPSSSNLCAGFMLGRISIKLGSAAALGPVGSANSQLGIARSTFWLKHVPTAVLPQNVTTGPPEWFF